MVTSYSQQVQQQGKCPHGFPIGACPICSGMMGGGASKDRNKPRKAGEMSYNECLAEWHKIQARNEAKMQDRLDRLEALKQFASNKFEAVVDKVQKFLDKVSQKLDAMPQVIKAPLKFIVKNIITPVIRFISQIPVAIKNIQVFFENTRAFIASVSEKLASVFGEVKNFINDKITKNYKKALKTILSLFTSGEDEDSEEAKKIKERELKKILKSIFRIKRKETKEEDDSKSV